MEPNAKSPAKEDANLFLTHTGMQPDSNACAIQDSQLSDISVYAREYKLIVSVTDAPTGLIQNTTSESVNATKDTLSSEPNVFPM